MALTPTHATLSTEAQHVIDSLEAHLGAILKAGQTAAPGVVSEIAKFADSALAKLDAWGLTLRGKVQALETDGVSSAAPAETLAGSTGPDSAAAAPVGAAPAGWGNLNAGAAASPAAAAVPASQTPGA